MKKNTKEKLVFLDGNAIVHRAFHALPPLTAPDGKPTNAVYGFVTILLKIIQELKPDYLIATFDLAAPTFRHKAFKEYKATRTKAPDELYAQIPVVKEILTLLHVPIYEKEGFEADDILGTGVSYFEKKLPVCEIIIVTGDLDTLQLVSSKTRVYTMRKGLQDTVLYDRKAVKERFGFLPADLIDYKGLRGDPSDNIPGVRGVGEKTAQKLIQKFKNIETLYKKIQSVKPDSLRERLEQSKEEAFFSKELATINRHVPIAFDQENARWRGDIKINKDLIKIFKTLGFQSLMRRLQMGVQENHKNQKENFTKNQSVAKGWVKISLPEELSFIVQKIKLEKKCALGLFEEEGVLQGLYPKPTLYGALPSGILFSIASDLFKDARIRDFLEDSSIKKIVFDSHILSGLFRSHNIFIRGVSFDIILAEYILQPQEKNHIPQSIVFRELKKNIARAEEAIPLLFNLEKKLTEKLLNGKLFEIFQKIELALVPFLVEMEFWGIALDQEVLARLTKETKKRLEILSRDIYEKVGETFNINSSQQVGVILFEKLGILEKGLRKTKGGARSTQASELSKIKGKHPAIPLILEYRELTKLQTTYIEALPALMSPKDQRIHTSFNQTATVTGRLSSSNPNLQNIPVRHNLGKEIRKAFVATDGFEFVAFDYSQIELRIAAHLSKDKKMIETFQQGLDIHSMTAAEINNISLEKVTSELRREAKTINFGILYGMGFRSFAEGAGISQERAKEFMNEYFKDFSGIRKFIDETKKKAYERGFVETLFGRRRHIPELSSPYIRVRLEGERMAINMPIQGTAADMIKLAMISIYENIILTSPNKEIRPILQIHDELVFEIGKGRRNAYVPRIQQIMQHIVQLSVPIVVDVEAGKNLGELK